MGATGTQGIWDIHNVLGVTRADNGAPMLRLGDVHGEEGADENVPFFQTPGFVSIYAPPDAGKSAGEAIVFKTGGTDYAFAGRDVRALAIAGNLKDGESCAYASLGAARTLYKADGRVVNYTTDDNTDQGHAIYSSVETTGFVRVCPWGRETFDEKGYHLLHASGARVDLGGISGMPAPLSALSSYATISAQMVRIEGAAISLGTAVGIPEPVAKATTLYALLQAISATLSTVSTALALVPAGTTPSPTAPPATALGTAITAATASVVALQGTITAALLTLPSASTQVT